MHKLAADLENYRRSHLRSFHLRDPSHPSATNLAFTFDTVAHCGGYHFQRKKLVVHQPLTTTHIATTFETATARQRTTRAFEIARATPPTESTF